MRQSFRIHLLPAGCQLRFTVVLLVVLSLSACQDKEPQAQSADVTKNDSAAKPKSSIDIQAQGIAVTGVYLSDDQGKALREEVVNPGQRFIFNILLDTGWVKQNGRSFIGAREELSIQSSNTVVASVNDLFADSAGVMDAEAAKHIKLGGFINPGSQTKSEYVMRFQVWDKKGEGTIWGSYRVRLRE